MSCERFWVLNRDRAEITWAEVHLCLCIHCGQKCPSRLSSKRTVETRCPFQGFCSSLCASSRSWFLRVSQSCQSQSRDNPSSLERRVLSQTPGCVRYQLLCDGCQLPVANQLHEAETWPLVWKVKIQTRADRCSNLQRPLYRSSYVNGQGTLSHFLWCKCPMWMSQPLHSQLLESRLLNQILGLFTAPDHVQH